MKRILLLFIIILAGVSGAWAGVVTNRTSAGDPMTFTQFQNLAGTGKHFAIVGVSSNNQFCYPNWFGFTGTFAGTMTTDYLFDLEESATEGDWYNIKRISDGKYVSTEGGNFDTSTKMDFKLVNRRAGDYASEFDNSELHISLDNNEGNHYNCNPVNLGFRSGTGGYSVYAAYGPFYIVTVNCINSATSKTIKTETYIVTDGTTVNAPDIDFYSTEGGSVTVNGADAVLNVNYTYEGVVYLSDLNSSKCYNIRNNRGTWAVGKGANDINSTVELELAFSASDAKQQFAFIYYDETDDDTDNGKYYLYSVGEGKFAYVNGNKLSLTENFNAEVAASPVTFGSSTNSTYKDTAPVLVKVGGQTFGVSTGISPDVFKYNDDGDGGNASSIVEAASFDATAATALVEFYFTHTLTYVVKDESSNTLFTSDPINIYKGTFNTLPTDYHRDYFFTYSTDGVTIDDESSANTNLIFTATAKSGILQYTANTTSPIYYNINIRSKYLAYNDEATGDVELLTSSTPFNPDAAWAFIGDPYTGFKIINQTNGTDKYLTYTSVVTGGNGGNNNIQFVDDGDFTNQYWYFDTNSNGFVLRMKANKNIYFHHDNNYNFLRTCSITEWSSVHTDAGSTMTFVSDEDVLVDLHAALDYIVYGSSIGQYTWGGSGTAEEARANISSAGLALTAHATSYYKDLYDALLDIQANSTLNTPAAGYYRFKNKATGKYLTAISGPQNYTATTKGVYANGNASSAATVIRLYDKNSDGKLYMYNQGNGFGWVDAGKVDGSGGVGYLSTNPDKYVNWFPTHSAGRVVKNRLAFALCYGNGTGSYASYLTRGIYTADTDDESVIAGNDYTADAAQWDIEEATSVTIPLNGPIDGNYYATMCLPFTVTLTGANAYTLTKDGTTLTPSDAMTEVDAGTPVLLIGNGTSATASIASDAEYASSPSASDLTGTFLAISDFDGATNYVLGTDGSKVGFFHWDGTTLAANRAYIAAGGGEVKGFYLNWDNATGIGEVLPEASQGKVYDLSGRMVDNRQNALPKGLYIINGRKAVVR